MLKVGRSDLNWRLKFTKAKRIRSEQLLVINDGKDGRLLTVLPSLFLDDGKSCVSAEWYQNYDSGNIKSINDVDLHVPIWRICIVWGHSIRRSKPAMLPWYDKRHHIVDKSGWESNECAIKETSKPFSLWKSSRSSIPPSINQAEAQSNTTTYVLPQLPCAYL